MELTAITKGTVFARVSIGTLKQLHSNHREILLNDELQNHQALTITVTVTNG